MEINGTIVNVFPARKGIGGNGAEWSAQAFIVESVATEWPESIVLTLWNGLCRIGEAREKVTFTPEVGMKGKFNFSCSTKLSKDVMSAFTQLRLWRFIPDGRVTKLASAPPKTPAADVQPPAVNGGEASASIKPHTKEQGELPF